MNLAETLPKLGITALTEMQEETLATAQQGDDLLLLSPTGSGKTLAFLLPLWQHLEAVAGEEVHSVPSVRVLILSPSRELALQTNRVWKSIDTPYPAVCTYGGHLMVDERRALVSQNPTLLIGTPGRVLDLIEKGYLPTADLTLLIIDEFDKSLELGFCAQMERLIELLPSLRRKWLISATDSEEIPRFLALGSGSGNPAIRIDYRSRELSLQERLKVYHVTSPTRDKLNSLLSLLSTLPEGALAMVFVNHREAVDRIYLYLKDAGVACESFHGGLEQTFRERALYRFRAGCSHVLICTDLAARGLDIPDVGAIIHYHLPPQEDGFTHRNGRTARWTATGAAYWLSSPDEALPEYLKLEDYEEWEVPAQPKAEPVAPLLVALYFGRGRKDKISRIDLVGFLCKKGGLSSRDIGLIELRDHHAYVAIPRKSLKQVLTRLRGEKIKGQRTIVEQAK